MCVFYFDLVHTNLNTVKTYSELSRANRRESLIIIIKKRRHELGVP